MKCIEIRTARPQNVMLLEDAARIFRVMTGRELPEDRERVTVGEVEEMTPAETFAEFLAWNRIRLLDREEVCA